VVLEKEMNSGRWEARERRDLETRTFGRRRLALGGLDDRVENDIDRTRAMLVKADRFGEGVCDQLTERRDERVRSPRVSRQF